MWRERRPPGTQYAAYVFHFTAAGETAPGWSAGGTPLTPPAWWTLQPFMALDGAGGPYVVWADFRTAPPGAVPGGFDDKYLDLYLQHVAANAAVAPGWPVNGLPVCTLAEQQKEPSIIADGFGGVIVTWQDYRDFYLQTYAQRINPDGTRAGGWPENGLLVQPSIHAIEARRLVLDGVGGAYFGVQDFSVSRCFIQHVLGNGTYDPTYGPEARPVSDTPSSQYEIAVAEDGAGGVYAVWNTGDNIWAQHFASDFPTAVSVSLVQASADPGVAHLVWQVMESVSGSFTLERTTGNGVFASVATLSPNGAGRLNYEDAVPEAGRYVYRLSFVEYGLRRTTPEVELEIPSAFVLSLSGFTPNPIRAGGGAVAFTLPRTAPGALVFYDLAGRACFRRDVGSLGPGRHTIPLAGAGLRSGVYWVRLTHDGRSLTTRGVMVQ